MTGDLQWYVLRAVSGQEKKVKQYIESEIKRNDFGNYVQQVIIPTEKVYEVRNGKKKTREKNYLPGYILVQAALQPEIMQTLKDVPGAIGFLGAEKGGNPIPLKEAEVNKILGKVDELEAQGEVMENPFVLNETIKVMDGPFSGFTGVIKEIFEDKKKLRVMVKIFGRDTPLELGFMQVEREQ